MSALVVQPTAVASLEHHVAATASKQPVVYGRRASGRLEGPVVDSGTSVSGDAVVSSDPRQASEPSVPNSYQPVHAHNPRHTHQQSVGGRRRRGHPDGAQTQPEDDDKHDTSLLFSKGLDDEILQYMKHQGLAGLSTGPSADRDALVVHDQTTAQRDSDAPESPIEQRRLPSGAAAAARKKLAGQTAALRRMQLVEKVRRGASARDSTISPLHP
jgi:hypothetical protein